MAKRRTLKRRWLEEKAKREELETRLYARLHDQMIRRTFLYEPIQMKLARTFHSKEIEERGIEFFKKCMIFDMLCRPWHEELSEEEYKKWLDVVRFEVRRESLTPNVTIIMLWYVIPANF